LVGASLPKRHPEDLDSALRMALQLEVWTKDRARLRGEKTQERNEVKKTREVTKTEAAPTVRENEALKKEVADQKWKIAELEAQMAKNSIRDQQDEAKTAEADKRPRPFACWGCRELGHSLRTCSERTMQEKKQFWEARLPPDIVYGSPDAEPAEDYDRFVERVRERTTTAFAEVRDNLKRSAERNKRYYNLGVKSKRFEVGQWVLYFNQRKLRGKQMKWKRQYEGPFLVIRTPSSVTAEIHKSAKTRASVVHIDKLKEYVGNPPKSWLAAAQDELDEVSQLGEAGASAERATRSTLDGGDDSEEPDEVDRAMSPEEVGKSSSGRVIAEVKSSSDNVSEGARRDEEAETKESPQERSLVENVYTKFCH